MRKSTLSFCLIMTILIMAGCSSGSNSASMSGAFATVTNQNGQGVSGVTVVLGDRNGAMKNSGITDAGGNVFFYNPPADATVTAAHSCLRAGATDKTFSLDVRYDVNQPVVLHIDDCSGASGSSGSSTYMQGGYMQGGTVTLNVTNAISEVTQNEISTNRPILPDSPGPELITTKTLTITSSDLQQDGKLSIYVIGRDSTGLPVGYGMALDRTFTNGMTVDITVDKPMSFVQYHVTNLPAAVTSLCSDLTQNRSGKGSTWVITCGNISSLSSSTTLSVPYIPGIGDRFYYSVSAFFDLSPSAMSSQFLSLGATGTVTDQNIDFSQALSVPALTVTGENTATPGATWSGQDPKAEERWFFARLGFASGFHLYLSISGLSPERTGITFPQLPDSLAEFRPTHLDYCSITTSAYSNGPYRSSSTDYYNRLNFAQASYKPASPNFTATQQHRQLLYQRTAGIGSSSSPGTSVY